MNGASICSEIKEAFGSQFVCSKQGDYERIRTPYLYPDGDYIDLYCDTRSNVVTVTDLAETTRWLWMQSASQRRSLKQNQLIKDTCETHGVEFHQGMLQARCKSGEPLAEVVTRVAQAALRVADLWFTFRASIGESITDEVAECLAQNDFQYERAKRMTGRSGSFWTVDFYIPASRDYSSEIQRDSLINVLSTSNRSAARRVSEHVVTIWHDLSHLAAGPERMDFISLFDDTSDIWEDKDFRLLESLSRVAYWSRPDEFTLLIPKAA